MMAMFEVPKTEYALGDGLHIAYQVVGEGPIDLLCVPGWVSHVELCWDDPNLARYLRRLASFSRLILFDKRGTGLSDQVPLNSLPTLEERMDDVRAVIDAVGSKQVALFGHSEGGNLSVLYAATYPERTTALITFGVFAKRIRSSDYPWAPTAEEREQTAELVAQEWGHEMDIADIAPSAANDPDFKRRLLNYLRRSASPSAAAALLRMNSQIDVRSVLPTIQAPTLVLHRTGDRDANIEEGRWIAGQIPGAKFIELPGEDHLPWVGDQDGVLDEIEEFLTGVRRGPDPDRFLTTVLFTDLVGSTQMAAQIGDRAWQELLERHHGLVRNAITRFRGTEIDTAGDGFLATFDGPARAVRCALTICHELRALGLEVRAGVHVGEVQRVDGEIGGIAVHTGARVAAAAEGGEVLVSSTVKDLVAGSGLEFEERGTHLLKGVPGEWRLFAAR
ncbi:MAG: adenylate/guanylate cyclase domain-containing protein [Phycisphaerales bacterium]